MLALHTRRDARPSRNAVDENNLVLHVPLEQDDPRQARTARAREGKSTHTGAGRVSIEIDKSLRDTPNPGSDAAVAAGCTCPVLDNGHGLGAWGSPGLFWMARSCPVHEEKERAE